MFTIAPTSSPSASPPKAKHAETNKCFFCQKAVFHMEKSEADGMVFHKNCFRCNECNKKVSIGSYASLEGKVGPLQLGDAKQRRTLARKCASRLRMVCNICICPGLPGLLQSTF